mmetsp:Transcript_24792/g.35714  ORF Transcript_24792/g.35714 Transcript_24792/m.35714 type:complete len:88 (+) Transcript_24792:259-522(+)
MEQSRILTSYGRSGVKHLAQNALGSPLSNTRLLMTKRPTSRLSLHFPLDRCVRREKDECSTITMLDSGLLELVPTTIVGSNNPQTTR